MEKPIALLLGNAVQPVITTVRTISEIREKRAGAVSAKPSFFLPLQVANGGVPFSCCFSELQLRLTLTENEDLTDCRRPCLQHQPLKNHAWQHIPVSLAMGRVQTP